MTLQKAHVRLLPQAAHLLLPMAVILFISGIASDAIRYLILDLSSYDNRGLLEAMESSPGIMLYAGTTILLKAAGYASVPLIAYLTTVKCREASHHKGMLLCSTAIALPLQILYALLEPSHYQLNSAFAVPLCIVTLYFIQKYNKLIGIITLIAALAWSTFLHIENGAAILICAFLLETVKNKTSAILAISLTMIAAFAFNAFYFFAPLSCILLAFDRNGGLRE